MRAGLTVMAMSRNRTGTSIGTRGSTLSRIAARPSSQAPTAGSMAAWPIHLDAPPDDNQLGNAVTQFGFGMPSSMTLASAALSVPQLDDDGHQDVR